MPGPSAALLVPVPFRRLALLAFASGAPALAYEIAWSRLVALTIGGQIEAISVVLVAYFLGLALGARVIGARADRSASPLRLYGTLEIAAGLLAWLSLPAIAAIGEHVAGRAPLLVVHLLLAATMLPATFALGGTLPALLRAGTEETTGVARRAGTLVAANTGGAVTGVLVAAVTVPLAGLRMTVLVAGVVAIAVGLIARRLARPGPVPPVLAPVRPDGRGGVRFGALVVAALAGLATMGFQVLAARAASLWLGSTLAAWALVLALFLVGLAAGNALIARRAAAGKGPRRDLGWIEVLAAVVVAGGLVWALPSPARPSRGFDPVVLAGLVAWILPATVMMGAAFPLFVRLAVRDAAVSGTDFGAVSASNTAGGIAGALLGPFVLLPTVGLGGGLLVTAGVNGLVGLTLLARPGAGARRSTPTLLGALALCGAAGAVGVLALDPAPPPGVRMIHVVHGRQATAAVARTAGRRDLLVDGEPEASTASNARRTEELLGALPVALHPDPRTLLEVGLGSGITFGMAADATTLERVECVEISGAVIDCLPYFTPANRGVADRLGARVSIVHADGRAYLRGRPGAYDLVVANTLHPWSVGATGLYSREYFARVRAALRTGGLAAQWVPLDGLGPESLAAIIRTFFTVFPHGAVWWGAENIILVGHDRGSDEADLDTLRVTFPAMRETFAALGIDSAAALRGRRVAPARLARDIVGPGPVLTDDRPLLELTALWRRADVDAGGEVALVARIAERAAGEDAAVRPLAAWLASRAARARGDNLGADRLAAEAEAGGLALVAGARVRNLVREGLARLAAGDVLGARARFVSALDEDADEPDARFSLAMIELRSGRSREARERLEQLVRVAPEHAEAWNLLAVLRHRAGETDAANAAMQRALAADPFFPEALANAGLFAVARGDRDEADRMITRLRKLGVAPNDGTLTVLREALEAAAPTGQ